MVENEPQKHLANAYFKSSTVDLLCKLKDGKIVNVEIQLYRNENHAKRIFYYASMIRRAFSKKGIDYSKLNDIIIIYLTKEDIFRKGSTVYDVDMNIVSDRKEIIRAWDCGLKVMYINTKGLTNKNINKYLSMLTDSITYLKGYKNTSKLKKELFETGGNKMSAKWLKKLFEESEEKGIEKGIEKGRMQGRQEGIISFAKGLLEKGILTKEQVDELSKEYLVTN